MHFPIVSGPILAMPYLTPPAFTLPFTWQFLKWIGCNELPTEGANAKPCAAETRTPSWEAMTISGATRQRRARETSTAAALG